MKGYKDPRNTASEGLLIEHWQDPWHVEEENKTQMLGTTKCGTVLEHSASSTSGLLVGQRGHRASQVQKSMHLRIQASQGLSFARLIALPSSLLHGHRKCRVSKYRREGSHKGE